MKSLLITLCVVSLGYGLLPAHSNTVLGIEGRTLHPDDAEQRQLPVPYGELVSRIYPGSGADAAGLQAFDYITAVNGKGLTEERQLGDLLAPLQPGDIAKISFFRKGQQRSVLLVLSNRNELDRSHRSASDDPFLGVSARHDELPDALAFGVPVDVVNNSTAQALGLMDGDVILAIDDNNMYSWHDMQIAIDDREIGDPIKLAVYRDGNYLDFGRPIKSRAARHGKHSRAEGPQIVGTPEPGPVQTQATVAEVEAEEMPDTLQRSVTAFAKTELPIDQLQIFPNPNSGIFDLQLELPERGETGIQILDSRGRLVYENSLGQFQGIFSDRIDIANTAKGLYFLRLQQKDRIVTRKIVIK